MFAPASDIDLAMLSPKPEVDPVITAVFPFNINPNIL